MVAEVVFRNLLYNELFGDESMDLKMLESRNPE